MSSTAHLPLAPPAGMRDLLPDETAEVQALAGAILQTFARHGYQRVTTPAFEYADVLERGLEVDRRDLIRFIEPDTGEVALLRPDLTPQVARIVATRMRELPPPIRVAYQGTIIRRKRGRARRKRQAAQAGIECMGHPSLEADAEVIRVAVECLHAVGLSGARVELGQARLLEPLLSEVPESMRSLAARALERKDQGALEAALCDCSKSTRKTLLKTLELYGGPEVIKTARRMFREQSKSLDQLTALIERLDDDVEVGIDLGEPRGRAYYTGVSFHLLVDGPGEPVGAGGRYDDLLGRFGAPMAATGFALDLDHLAWALRKSGCAPKLPRSLRVVMDESHRTEAAQLRQAGSEVALHPRPTLDFARAWGYDALLHKGRWRLLSGATKKLTHPIDINALRAWVQSEE